MRRLEAIRRLAAAWTDELVVATTGMISRELFVARDRVENFYMCGSMGCALGIGLGVALVRPGRKVVVLDGDGAALMSLGSLALAGWAEVAAVAPYALLGLLGLLAAARALDALQLGADTARTLGLGVERGRGSGQCVWDPFEHGACAAAEGG